MISRTGTAIALVMLVVGCRDDPGRTVLVGTLERDRIEISAEAFEPIVEIAVREGESVSAGQPVLRLDDARVRGEVAQADALRAQASARLAEIVRGPRPERISEARAQLVAAESAVTREERELARSVALASKSVESRQQLDLARARHEQVVAQRNAASAVLEQLLNGATAEELEQARATLAQAEAALAVARVRLDRLVVRAPRAGRVDSMPFHLGERPPVGVAVAVMLSNGLPYARVFVPETIRARVAPGTLATVRLDGVARAFTARVRTVSADAAFTPHYALTELDRGHLAYEAKVDLTEAEAESLPTGLPVRVRLEIAADAG